MDGYAEKNAGWHVYACKAEVIHMRKFSIG